MHAAAQPSTLYSRHEHGGHPVHIHEHGASRCLYEVDWPAGPATYPSARSLLRALYSGGDGSTCARDPGISFKRYFRLGLGAPEPVDVLALLGVPRAPTPQVVRPIVRTRRAPTPKARRPRGRSPKVTVEGPWWTSSLVLDGSKMLKPAAWVRSEPKPAKAIRARVARAKTVRVAPAPLSPTPNGKDVLGIDLAGRGHEVRKLLFAGFGGRMARYHYDPEDVLQEVYRGLLARNIGRCPWDIKKSSFGHYVHMVCSCVLNNYARKLRRRGEFEQLGLGALNRDGQWAQVDAAEVAVADPASITLEEPTARWMALNALGAELSKSERPEAKLAMKVLPMVAEGYQRGEIARRVGVEPAKVGKALSLIRGVTAGWAAEQGLR